jgi:hypothetical protein
MTTLIEILETIIMGAIIGAAAASVFILVVTFNSKKRKN